MEPTICPAASASGIVGNYRNRQLFQLRSQILAICIPPSLHPGSDERRDRVRQQDIRVRNNRVRKDSRVRVRKDTRVRVRKAESRVRVRKVDSRVRVRKDARQSFTQLQ